ncbi:MAG TPA: hypothetical protein VII75_16725 [Thermoanaerobaculia bacterium]
MTVKLGNTIPSDRNAALHLLQLLCADADLAADPSGEVRPRNPEFCGRAREDQPACRCICDAIAAPRTITIVIREDLESFGGGRTDDDVPDDTSNGKGSDETVNVEKRNRWHVRDSQGNWIDDPDWVILGHELCGHAVAGALGKHPEWRPTKKGYDPNWHARAFETEDAIRKAAGLPELGEHSPSLK